MIQVNKRSLRHSPSAKKKKKMGGISSNGPCRFAGEGKRLWRGLGRWGAAGSEPFTRQATAANQGRASSAPLPRPAHSPAQPPARWPTSRSRLPVAPRCLPGGSPSTVVAVRAPPRGGVRRARPQLSDPLSSTTLARGRGRPRSGGRRREGHLTVVAGSAPDPGVGWTPL